MALIGANNEEKIWNHLKAKGLNDYGVAGCMGNLNAESALRPNNLQNTYEKKLGLSDDEYVAAVDSGKYTNFVKDSAGFGLAQWTYWSRKQDLLNFAQAEKKSIGDLEMQLDFLWKELSESYKSVLTTLKTATSVRQASDDVLLKFERPADTSESVQIKRASYGQQYYDKYASESAQEPTGATQGSQAGNSSTTTQSASKSDSDPSVGDVVQFRGTAHYVSSNSVKAIACKPGEAKVTAIAKNAKHPYHLQKTSGSSSTVYGWVDAADIDIAGSTTTNPTTTDKTNTNTNTSTGGSKMKYNSSNKPLVCMMTQSTCYKGTSKMKPVGVLWHSTGANNPTLKRYVQPDDNASNRAELLALIGKNSYNNDWNHITHQAGLNCWIGKLADGTVTTIQTMPWDYKPWGCGSGSKGSCNNGWIQFEICEDGLSDATYFNKVYQEACEITAYLCDLYDIDPNGYTTLNGVKVPNILCHADSHSLGLGSNHGDVNHWFPKHGKSMATARTDVAKLMGTSSSTSTTTPSGSSSTTSTSSVKAGDTVKISSDATYYTGKVIPSWVKNKNWIVKEVNGDRAVIDKSSDGKNAICSPVNTKYLSVVTSSSGSSASSFSSYMVRVTASALNYRKGPGTNYAIAGTIKDKGVYTIVDESSGTGATKWGKLKSGAGWISLDYCKKV